MGYYRPVDQWNIGKRQEFAERVNFNIEKVVFTGGQNAP